MVTANGKSPKQPATNPTRRDEAASARTVHTWHAPVVKAFEAPDDVPARGLLDVRALVVEDLGLHLREAFV